MSKRTQRVDELLKREISTCLERDFEFPGILVTIHQVDVTPDLREAKVHIGVIGGEFERSAAVAKLNKKHGMIQNVVAKRVVLRNTPRLTFHLDDSIERGNRIVDILEDIGEIPDYDEDGNIIPPKS